MDERLLGSEDPYAKSSSPEARDGLDLSILIVDDNAAVRDLLETTFVEHGFSVIQAPSVREAAVQIQKYQPRYAVIDLSLGDGTGLDVLKVLIKTRPNARAVVLTGYGDITTAVYAAKNGATDYLTKPVDPELVASVLLSHNGRPPAPPEKPMSADRVRWEHIMGMFEHCDRNVSETARRLDMHRRTLQRILAKSPPR